MPLSSTTGRDKRTERRHIQTHWAKQFFIYGRGSTCTSHVWSRCRWFRGIPWHPKVCFGRVIELPMLVKLAMVFLGEARRQRRSAGNNPLDQEGVSQNAGHWRERGNLANEKFWSKMRFWCLRECWKSLWQLGFLLWFLVSLFLQISASAWVYLFILGSCRLAALAEARVDTSSPQWFRSRVGKQRAFSPLAWNSWEMGQPWW